MEENKYTFENPEFKNTYRHTTSHILAQAVKRLYPEVKLAIGPAIENGFYYDFDAPFAITPEILEKIEVEMRKICKEKIKLERFELPREEAVKFMQEREEPYKVELINDLPEDAVISFYKQGDFTDLCAGPHLDSTGRVKGNAIKLTSCTGAYWRGDSSKKMLQRVYGTCFMKKEELDEYLARIEEAKKRDHRKLGRELGLFMLTEEGPGFPFFLPKGMVLKNTLIEYWREIHKKYGYVEALDKCPMPGADSSVTWDEFISYVADLIQPLLSKANNIGFCFSYPVEITPDCDGRVLSLTKQVKIEDAVGKYIGASLRTELERRGENPGKIVVLNDTPAVLLAGKAVAKESCDGYIGLVAGTGCNTCCEIDCADIKKIECSDSKKMLVNLESGSFAEFPRGDADIAMDAELPDTGEYIAEKMISGRYLGQVCMYTLKMAASEGLFSERATEIIEKMTEVATPTIDKWGIGRFPKGFNSEDRVNLVYIINEIFERSARCIACKLCGILEVTGAGASRPVCIAVDGSLFTESKLLRPELERFMDVYAGEIMGRRYEFVTADNMSLIGTAVAVLLG